MLSGAQCAALVARADVAFDAACAGGAPPPADLKVDLSADVLRAILGAGTTARFVGLAAALLQPMHQHLSPHFILRRRCALPPSP